MSEKFLYHPESTPRDSGFDRAPVDGPEQVSSFIRRIQADAEQICNDAVDIEDARFLAADIVDVCRRFVSKANADPADRHSPGLLKSAAATPSIAAPPEGVDTVQAEAARSKLASLSAREREIFAGLAEGQSATEIAVKLSRSTKTINNHRTRILQKLGLKNSAELVRLALRSGVISV